MILNNKEQKSPIKRFLFILRLGILFVYLGLGLIFIFFNKLIPINPERFPREYQIGFGAVLILYGLIRFGRLIKKEDEL